MYVCGRRAYPHRKHVGESESRGRLQVKYSPHQAGRTERGRKAGAHYVGVRLKISAASQPAELEARRSLAPMEHADKAAAGRSA